MYGTFGWLSFDELTPEQQEKARNCKTAEDVHALAEEEGYELSDNQLEGVAGGDDCPDVTNPCCPYYCDERYNCAGRYKK